MLSIQFYFYIVPTTLLQVFALRVVLVRVRFIYRAPAGELRLTLVAQRRDARPLWAITEI